MANIQRILIMVLQRQLMQNRLRRTLSFAATFAKYKPKKQIQWFQLFTRASFAILGMVLPPYIFQEDNYNEVQDYDYDKPKVKKMLMSIEESMELKLDAALKNIHKDHKHRKKYTDERLKDSVSKEDFEEFKEEMLERVTALKASLHTLIEKGSTVMEDNKQKILKLEHQNKLSETVIESQQNRIYQLESKLIAQGGGGSATESGGEMNTKQPATKDELDRNSKFKKS